ncbi:conjugal transfer protein [Streptococcus canis]|uniref:conjugal transfer protein n=1 Tax=Streptococcus canis TaxID=1329 RepID=UPI0029978D6C|nr:conjugal transfer protein [Streptococcus canis]
MMLIKRLYQNVVFLPKSQDYWNVFIILLKEKDYFYDCFATCLSDTRRYQHSYFDTEGHALHFNQKMTPELLAYFTSICQQNKQKFLEVIIMATQTALTKKIKATAVELGELLKAQNVKEAWTKAGELNSLIKKEGAKDLPEELIDSIRSELRGYYYVNSELNKFHKQLYAKGNKLIELGNS